MSFWVEGGKRGCKKGSKNFQHQLAEDNENSMARQFTDDELKKMKVAELLALAPN